MGLAPTGRCEAVIRVESDSSSAQARGAGGAKIVSTAAEIALIDLGAVQILDVVEP